MPSTPEELDLEQLLRRIETDRHAIPWMQRRAVAAQLGLAVTAVERQGAAIRLLYLLADDPKWEVRKEVATLLTSLPDDDFAPLTAKLSQDSNGFVRKAAERAMNLRQKGVREVGNRRRGLEQVVAQFDLFGLAQGHAASEKVRGLAMRLYEVSVAATVHDLRGVLTSACSHVAQLRTEASRSPMNEAAVQEGLSRIADRLGYLEKFVNAMGAYSQSISAERVVVPLDRLVRDAHGVAVDAVRSAKFNIETVDVSLRVEDGITILAAQHLVVAALANVIKNAYEAVLLDKEIGKTGSVRLEATSDAGGEVRIVVQDNGMGMSTEDLREIRTFIPGRTTKKGYGTGFGLPIADRYIAAHGGSIAVNSEDNLGTKVTIVLPSELVCGAGA